MYKRAFFASLLIAAALPLAAQAAVESSAGLQQSIRGISPTVEGYLAPAFAAIDGARASAAGALNSQLASTQAAVGSPTVGSVISAPATQHAASDPLGAFLYILRVLYFYVLTVLLFIINSAAICYLLVLLAVLYILWRVLRSFRRSA